MVPAVADQSQSPPPKVPLPAIVLVFIHYMTLPRMSCTYFFEFSTFYLTFLLYT